MVEFIDPGADYHHERARPDPLAPARSAEFDWQTVFANLDGETGDSGMVPQEQAAAALAALLRWVCQPALEPPSRPDATLSGIGTRALAALHAISPESFAGTPSQARLAAAFGKSHAWLTRAASEFSREFGIVNGFGQHGRGGAHRQKLKVAFAPPVRFAVAIKTAAGVAVAPAVAADATLTPPDDQTQPEPKQEALPHE